MGSAPSPLPPRSLKNEVYLHDCLNKMRAFVHPDEPRVLGFAHGGGRGHEGIDALQEHTRHTYPEERCVHAMGRARAVISLELDMVKGNSISWFILIRFDMQ